MKITNEGIYLTRKEYVTGNKLSYSNGFNDCKRLIAIKLDKYVDKHEIYSNFKNEVTKMLDEILENRSNKHIEVDI